MWSLLRVGVYRTMIQNRYKLLVGVDVRKWNSMGLRQQVSQNVPQF